MKDGGESGTFLVIWQLATETVDTVWWAKGPEPSPSNVGVLSPTKLANQPEHASSTTTHMQYVRAPPGDRSRWAGELSSTRQSSPNDRRAANEILQKPPGITSLHDHKRGGLDSRHKRFKACSSAARILMPPSGGLCGNTASLRGVSDVECRWATLRCPSTRGLFPTTPSWFASAAAAPPRPPSLRPSQGRGGT